MALFHTKQLPSNKAHSGHTQNIHRIQKRSNKNTKIITALERQLQRTWHTTPKGTLGHFGAFLGPLMAF